MNLIFEKSYICISAFIYDILTCICSKKKKKSIFPLFHIFTLNTNECCYSKITEILSNSVSKDL